MIFCYYYIEIFQSCFVKTDTFILIGGKIEEKLLKTKKDETPLKGRCLERDYTPIFKNKIMDVFIPVFNKLFKENNYIGQS